MKKFFRFILTIVLVIILILDMIIVAAILNSDKKLVMTDWLEQVISHLEDTGDKEKNGEYEPAQPEVTETITGEVLAEPSGSELVAYHKLSEEEKQVYDTLRDGIASHVDEIEIEPEVEKSVLEKCLTCVYMDHPEYYWFDNNYTYWMVETTGKISSIEPAYLMTEDEIAAYDSSIRIAANEILDGTPVEASSYEKVKHIYEAVIFSTEYAEGCQYNQSMASVFLNRQSVCAGYAKAVQYLLHELDIPCTYISGTAIPFISSDGSPQPHAWNIAELDGGYYYIDATWGDPLPYENGSKKEIEYGYLCCSPSIFEQSHTPNLPVSMPECTSETFDYYRMNNLYYEVFNREEINARLIQMTKNGMEQIEFAFGTEEAYQEMMTELLNHGLADEAGEMRAFMTGADRWQWGITYNDYLRCIEFQWAE